MTTIHVLRNISGSKGNLAMRFEQLIRCSMRNIFFQKSCRKCGRKNSSRSPFVFRKALFKVKASSQHLSFLTYFGRPRLGHTIKR